MKVARIPVFLCVTLLAEVLPALAGPVKSLRVVLPPQHGPVVEKALQLFTRQVTDRCGAKVATAGEAPLTVEFAVQPGIGKDGFTIAAGPAGSIRIIGNDDCGLLYGVGKLLRTSRYDQGGFTPGTWRGTSVPTCPVRGIYFATHFKNFYHMAPLEEVDRLIEDIALWGGNQLMVWFDMHHFNSFQDPAAQAHLVRLRHFGETAHAVGMKFGIAFLANEAYAASPQELRADRNTGRAHYGVELCPSKPKGLELIGRWQAELLDAFPSLDFLWTWPYDQGGCACPKCKPWGANGYLRASEQLAKLYHQRFPRGELWLSTWLFDHHRDEGEFGGLFQYIREKQPTWFTGIIAGAHAGGNPKPLLARPFPERYPLTCFPEISMYQMVPWGGFGANPLPDYCTQLAEKLRGHIVGGWPYSEGIYEDVNKFFWVQFFWRPDRPTDEILAEYVAYYLGPESTGDAVRLFHLMEKTHSRRGWQVRNFNEADDARALAQAIDGRLAPWAKTSWRWRILYIRTAIDHVLKNQGVSSPEAQAALKPLCDELVRIYHAENTFIRPPKLPKSRRVKILSQPATLNQH